MTQPLTLQDKQLVVRINCEAIKTVEKTYGNLALSEADPRQVSSYLGVCGLRCMACGRQNISFQTLKFFGFVPEVLCFNCQKVNSSNLVPR